MKKVYLKVEYGSRGEMEVIGLVETSADEVSVELDEIVNDCEDEDEKEYCEEFMYISENKFGVLNVGVSEEESYTLIDYELNKEKVDKILEIDKLCKDEKMEWKDGDVIVNDILQELDL
jgi:hypothetical protein